MTGSDAEVVSGRGVGPIRTAYGRNRNTVGINKTPIVTRGNIMIASHTWSMRSTLTMGQHGRTKTQKVSAGEKQGDVNMVFPAS